MRAMRFHQTGGPEVLQHDDIAPPEPGPGQVRVRVAATGINFIEIYQRLGQYTMPLPFTPGGEAAGVVDAVGPAVTEFAVGDRVASASMSGAYAEYALAPVALTAKIPDTLDAKVAAAVMLQGMTAHYLSHSTFPLHSGHTALIHAGAGGVGLLLIQIARRLGARVIATVGSDAKAQLARTAGADAVVIYTRDDFVAATKAFSDGRGVDVVYDSVGKTTFDQSLLCLHPRGMLVLFGQSSGPVPPFDPQILNARGSLFLTRPTLHHHIATREEFLARAVPLFGWITAGELAVRIGAEFPLAEAGQAQAALAGRATTGKVVLIP